MVREKLGWVLHSIGCVVGKVGHDHGKNGNPRRGIGINLHLARKQDVYIKSEKLDTTWFDKPNVNNKETIFDNSYHKPRTDVE